jgi:NAD(P)-dependent dehydrogenase (short-subunit alcohol dehydrogenase family)
MFASRKAGSSFCPFTLSLNDADTERTANPITPAYCATKFAIRGLTQAAGTSFFLAEIDTSRSLADKGRFAAQEFGAHGITVNAYAPGAVDTRLSQYLLSIYALLTSRHAPTVAPLKTPDASGKGSQALAAVRIP